MGERKENFVDLCKEVGVTSKSSWSEFSREQAKDERFKAIEKSRDREAHFNDYVSELKKMISEDPRYVAVDKSNDREDWFLDYVQELKDEHRREKDKKRADRSRSRSSSR